MSLAQKWLAGLISLGAVYLVVSNPQGFTGLAPVIVPDPGASAPEIHGGPADPAHGQQFWEEPPRYPWLVYEADASLGGASAETSIMGAEPTITGSGTD